MSDDSQSKPAERIEAHPPHGAGELIGWPFRPVALSTRLTYGSSGRRIHKITIQINLLHDFFYYHCDSQNSEVIKKVMNYRDTVPYLDLYEKIRK